MGTTRVSDCFRKEWRVISQKHNDRRVKQDGVALIGI